MDNFISNGDQVFEAELLIRYVIKINPKLICHKYIKNLECLLLEACQHDAVHIINMIINNKHVDPNESKYMFSSKLLFNKKSRELISPLLQAIRYNSMKTIILLLSDSRVNTSSYSESYINVAKEHKDPAIKDNIIAILLSDNRISNSLPKKLKKKYAKYIP